MLIWQCLPALPSGESIAFRQVRQVQPSYLMQIFLQRGGSTLHAVGERSMHAKGYVIPNDQHGGVYVARKQLHQALATEAQTLVLCMHTQQYHKMSLVGISVAYSNHPARDT